MVNASPPRLALTAGEPAGIGPDLCLMLAQKKQDAQLVVIADPELLGHRASLLGLDIRLTLFDPKDDTPARAGELLVHPVSMGAFSRPGQVNSENSRYVLQTLEIAVDGCLKTLFHGMVTAPIHKKVINDSGIAFSGHTEFLAKKTGVDLAVMMLATEGLRVALATTHLPLSEVSNAITQSLLTKVLQIIYYDMRYKFLLPAPRILVCGLNPHAGEGGQIGREEIDVIAPVIENLNHQGMDIVGPLSADTLFHPDNLRQADVVLAMYHDQGLPVLKYQGFGNAVNITLGLPIVRTSVDHGTALALAGTGKACCGSLNLAINTAVMMINNNLL